MMESSPARPIPSGKQTLIQVVAVINGLIGLAQLWLGLLALWLVLDKLFLDKEIGPADVNDVLALEVEGYYTYMGARGLGLAVLGFTLVIASIGVFQRHGWGKEISVAYAVFSLPLHVLFVGWQLLKVFPYALERFGAQVAQADVFNQLLDAWVGLIVGNGLFCLHAVGLLVFLNVPGICEQFSARPRRAGPVPFGVDEFTDLEPRFPDSPEPREERPPWSVE